jgi:hypothetical protein
MIKLILKFSLAFIVSFSLLCIPVNNHPVFLTFYKYFGPQVLNIMHKLVDSRENKFIPQFVKLIKSEPSNLPHLPNHYQETKYFDKKRFTTEEKHLMMKALFEQEGSEE